MVLFEPTKTPGYFINYFIICDISNRYGELDRICYSLQNDVTLNETTPLYASENRQREDGASRFTWKGGVPGPTTANVQ
jgi:hypothetical protein